MKLIGETMIPILGVALAGTSFSPANSSPTPPPVLALVEKAESRSRKAEI
jgi:hypothetical protein